MKIIPTDVSEYIMKKYGANRIRKYIKYYSANIPEIYWQADKDESDQAYMNQVKDMYKNQNKNLALISPNLKRLTRLLSFIAAENIDANETTKYFDFLNISNLIRGKFGDFNPDVFSELDGCETIIICGIRHGEFFQKYSDYFATFVNNLINSPIKKNIILGITYNGNVSDDDFSIKFNNLIDLMNDYFLTITIKDENETD
jgi:hypothetical protein